MTDDMDETPRPAAKPGFFRRLFGGSTPAPEEPAAEEPAAQEPAEPEPVPENSESELAAERDAAAAPSGTHEPEPETAILSEAITPDVFDEGSPILSEPDDVLGADPVFIGRDAGPGEPEQAKSGWFAKLRHGLARSSSSISKGIVDIFAKRKLDATTLEDLDDILIRADLGVATAARITEAVSRGRYDKTIDPEDVKAVLAEQVEAVLAPVARPLEIPAEPRPYSILVIGVNGSGKTTTIGKLAAKFSAGGRSVMLAAGDTFRAAAVEQLRVWGARTGATVVTRDQGADAAGLAFDALKQAQNSGTDILLIDTAGRLQNRTELMDELAKVIRVLRKIDPEAPHAVLLVLDATVGQNALNQVEIFSKVAGVTGLIMTKLDGTARGGILVAIAERFGLPVHFIGVGEGVDDLEPFQARDFARAIAGLE